MSLLHRRRRVKKTSFFKRSDTITDINEDYRRLLLLENAVINYGGGRGKLEMRTRYMARRLQTFDADAAAVLYDAAAYLRDIGIAGNLEDEDS